jgi:hypothetical protein
MSRPLRIGPNRRGPYAGPKLQADPPPQRHLALMMTATVAASWALFAGPDVHALSRVEMGQQTQGTRIGQPLVNSQLAFKPSNRVDAETYEVRTPAQTLPWLNPGYQTVGNWLQSAMAYKPSLKVEAEQDLARRTPPQYPISLPPATVGQSLPVLSAGAARYKYELHEDTFKGILSTTLAAGQVTGPFIGQPLINSALPYRASLQIDAEQDTARHPQPPYPSFQQPLIVGQSLPMLMTTSLRVEAEQQETRLSVTGPSIHIFRTAYQTVGGMTLAQLHKPSTRVEAESYEVRSPAPTVHAFRTGYQTVAGFTLAQLWKASQRLEAEAYEVRSAPPYIHAFRPGFQTVGQPLVNSVLGAKPVLVVEAEAYQVRTPLRAPQIPVSTAVAGQPLPILAYRTPRNHDLFDGPGFTVVNKVQYACNVEQPPSAFSQYDPLSRLYRKPLPWQLIEPTRFEAVLNDTGVVKTPSISITSVVYDFEFGYWTYDVPDLNDDIWKEQVRYHKNHAYAMQAFRQYGSFTITTKQFDAVAKGSTTFCAEVDSFDPDAATPPATWVDETVADNLWTPPPAPPTGWSPPTSPSGAWTDTTVPDGGWSTTQKTC